jgi:uncharacterized surface protein with fasciclin (FAS1) repeats
MLKSALITGANFSIRNHKNHPEIGTLKDKDNEEDTPRGPGRSRTGHHLSRRPRPTGSNRRRRCHVSLQDHRRERSQLADQQTLVAAVKAGGLVDTLNSPGPFTVFAPTDDAFAKLPAGTVETLVKPENKDTLDKILTYHVVPGRITARELDMMIKKGGGKAALKTVQGEDLTATMSGGHIMLTDAKGGMATITTADVFQSNGVIHVIDTVLMPN